VSPTTIWPRRWPARGRVVACGAVPAADRPRSAYPAELVGGVPGVGRRHGQVGRAVRRTVRCQSLVHQWCPPRSGSGPVSSRPVSSRSVSNRPVSNRGVSGHLAASSRTDLSGRLVPPSGGQLCGVRPSVLWRLSRPGVSPPWPLGARRSRTAFAAGVDRVPGGLLVPERRRRRLRRLGRRPRLRRSWVDRGERGARGSRTWAGLRLGCGAGRAELLTDQGGQPGLGRLVAGGCPGPGTRDYCPWSLSSLTPEWTGLKGP
jgi:hypothetical protein